LNITDRYIKIFKRIKKEKDGLKINFVRKKKKEGERKACRWIYMDTFLSFDLKPNELNDAKFLFACMFAK
jgi:hypothetical protein